MSGIQCMVHFIFLPDSAQVKNFSFSNPQAIQNETVVLTCTALGVPQPMIEIYRHDTGEVLSTANTTSLQYSINNVDCLDNGVYECKTWNYINNNKRNKYTALDSKCKYKYNFAKHFFVFNCFENCGTLSLYSLVLNIPC